MIRRLIRKRENKAVGDSVIKRTAKNSPPFIMCESTPALAPEIPVTSIQFMVL
jgi:hypothetical protein